MFNSKESSSRFRPNFLSVVLALSLLANSYSFVGNSGKNKKNTLPPRPTKDLISPRYIPPNVFEESLNTLGTNIFNGDVLPEQITSPELTQISCEDAQTAENCVRTPAELQAQLLKEKTIAYIDAHITAEELETLQNFITQLQTQGFTITIEPGAQPIGQVGKPTLLDQYMFPPLLFLDTGLAMESDSEQIGDGLAVTAAVEKIIRERRLTTAHLVTIFTLDTDGIPVGTPQKVPVFTKLSDPDSIPKLFGDTKERAHGSVILNNWATLLHESEKQADAHSIQYFYFNFTTITRYEELFQVLDVILPIFEHGVFNRSISIGSSKQSEQLAKMLAGHSIQLVNAVGNSGKVYSTQTIIHEALIVGGGVCGNSTDPTTCHLDSFSNVLTQRPQAGEETAVIPQINTKDTWYNQPIFQKSNGDWECGKIIGTSMAAPEVSAWLLTQLQNELKQGKAFPTAAEMRKKVVENTESFYDSVIISNTTSFSVSVPLENVAAIDQSFAFKLSDAGVAVNDIQNATFSWAAYLGKVPLLSLAKANGKTAANSGTFIDTTQTADKLNPLLGTEYLSGQQVLLHIQKKDGVVVTLVSPRSGISSIFDFISPETLVFIQGETHPGLVPLQMLEPIKGQGENVECGGTVGLNEKAFLPVISTQ